MNNNVVTDENGNYLWPFPPMSLGEDTRRHLPEDERMKSISDWTVAEYQYLSSLGY